MDDAVLFQIADLLNAEGILWAVGGSWVLNHYGLGNPPRDIDLLVAVEDAQRADRLLAALGEKQQWQESAVYATRHFNEYMIGETEVDLMAGLRINHAQGCYTYVFQPDSITGQVRAGKTVLPLTALEDWYVLYQLIPGREGKVDLIESFLEKQGISRLDLLVRACQGCLPDAVRKRIETFAAAAPLKKAGVEAGSWI